MDTREKLLTGNVILIKKLSHAGVVIYDERCLSIISRQA
jgi:hypothetical protein